jgi:uncharacterized UPF0146 family protein
LALALKMDRTIQRSLRGAADLAGYIGRNYSGRVVEVGVGHVPDVALLLMRVPYLEVVVTDREECLLAGLRVEKDDIFSPRLDLYKGASLLYSLRPPLEMQLAMGAIAGRIGADVLIRPLQDEVAQLPGFARRLVNAGEARFYLFRLASPAPDTEA